MTDRYDTLQRDATPEQLLDITIEQAAIDLEGYVYGAKFKPRRYGFPPTSWVDGLDTRLEFLLEVSAARADLDTESPTGDAVSDAVLLAKRGIVRASEYVSGMAGFDRTRLLSRSGTDIAAGAYRRMDERRIRTAEILTDLEPFNNMLGRVIAFPTPAN